MKFLAVLSLSAILTSAIAAEEYGGITFYSNVEPQQTESMKNDLNYLYNTPISKVDQEFLKVAELPSGDGKNMHNWLLNRVRHVVGESFVLNEQTIAIGILQMLTFKFPDTPIPPIYLENLPDDKEPEAPESKPEDEDKSALGPIGPVEPEPIPLPENEDDAPKIVMSNLGSAVYMMGKMSKVLLGIKVDDEKIYAKSPRVGIIQVGEGLFFKDFMLNKDNVNAPANSISRLGTFFHEARHSDGTGISTTFAHDICPEGHPMAGYAACEASGNGPYTIGALTERHLIRNCTSCSNEELGGLTMKVADSFSRIIDKTMIEKRQAVEEQIAMLEVIAKMYEEALKTADEAQKAQIMAEVELLKAEYNRLVGILIGLMVQPDSLPAPRDASPEGKFETVSLKESTKLMDKSIKKALKKK